MAYQAAVGIACIGDGGVGPNRHRSLHLDRVSLLNQTLNLEVEDAACIPLLVGEEEVHSGLHHSTKFNSTSKWTEVVHCFVKVANAFDHDGHG